MENKPAIIYLTIPTVNTDFQEKFFQRKGVVIKYIQKGSGEPILFLHGGGVRALTCSKILNLLSKNYHVIAPDLPCFGESSVPNEIWGLEEYADFFNEFIESLEIKDLTVVGHSLGGGVALNLATQNRRIKKLILVDSAWKRPPYSEIKFRYKLYFEETFVSLLHYKNIPTLLLIVKDYCLNRIRKFREWSKIVKITKKCLLNDFNRFSEVKTQTLILWGKQDELFPARFAEILHREISGSYLQVMDGNHNWILFKHRKFVEIIDNWIKIQKEFAAKKENQS